MEVEWNLLFARSEFEVPSVTMICRGSTDRRILQPTAGRGSLKECGTITGLLAPRVQILCKELRVLESWTAYGSLKSWGQPPPGLSPPRRRETAYLQHLNDKIKDRGSMQVFQRARLRCLRLLSISRDFVEVVFLGAGLRS
jgi:hypothetical protein